MQKKMSCRYILVCSIAMLLCCPGSVSFAQTNTDKQLALQYFQNEEYDKAAIAYENLFNKSRLDYYYNYYLKCLIKLEDYEKAVKVTKKQVKRNPQKLNYLVDLGYVYKTSKDLPKSTQQFDKALKILEPDQQQIVNLANAFLSRQEDAYSVNAYLKGRKLLKNSYSFHFELAHVYYRSGQPHLMINEYLNLLHKEPNRKSQIQNILQSRLFQDLDKKAQAHLRNELISRMQKYPSKLTYSEMLIWLYVQQEDFASALVQAKAVDTRRNEEGNRIIKLGLLAKKSKNYNVAINSFEYVIEKGENSTFYIIARRELLSAFNEKIISQDYTQEDLEKLEASYLAAIEELGKSQSMVKIMRGLAHLQAFYMHNTSGAIELLEEIIAMAGVPGKEKARCKLELADILVLKGLVWDASLYYSQIDKAFKNDPIGHEAKFRNARLFYYNGEFEWAQTQLDVLKASTSKLIANDAMDLALLITDNTIMDSTTDALLLFASAELMSFQNKNDSALFILTSIQDSFPMHSLTDDIFLRKAEIFAGMHQYDAAIEALALILSDYPMDIHADDALFMMAGIYETKLGDREKAMELYEQMLLTYPGSLFVVESRKRFRNLRGDKLN